MAKQAEKIINDPKIGEVTFRKSVRSRSMSIRVHPVKGVSVSVPYVVPYAVAQAFFLTRREWIIETMARQKERCKDVVLPTPEEVEEIYRKAYFADTFIVCGISTDTILSNHLVSSHSWNRWVLYCRIL